MAYASWFDPGWTVVVRPSWVCSIPFELVRTYRTVSPSWRSGPRVAVASLPAADVPDGLDRL